MNQPDTTVDALAVLHARIGCMVDLIDAAVIDAEDAAMPPALLAHLQAAFRAARTTLTIATDDLAAAEAALPRRRICPMCGESYGQTR